MASVTPATELVLDTWPVLEWLKNREPAATRFEELADDAVAGSTRLVMSRINYGEVLYSIRKSFPADHADKVLQAFRRIPIQLYSVDDDLVDEAAALKAIYTCSYADAFAAALAIRRSTALVTGDREFLPLAQTGLRLYWVGA